MIYLQLFWSIIFTLDDFGTLFSAQLSLANTVRAVCRRRSHAATPQINKCVAEWVCWVAYLWAWWMLCSMALLCVTQRPSIVLSCGWVLAEHIEGSWLEFVMWWSTPLDVGRHYMLQTLSWSYYVQQSHDRDSSTILTWPPDFAVLAPLCLSSATSRLAELPWPSWLRRSLSKREIESSNLSGSKTFVLHISDSCGQGTSDLPDALRCLLKPWRPVLPLP